jgi:hypothetical protein
MAPFDGALDAGRVIRVEVDAQEELDLPSGVLMWLTVALGVIVGIAIGALIS